MNDNHEIYDDDFEMAATQEKQIYFTQIVLFHISFFPQLSIAEYEKGGGRFSF